MGIFPRAGSIPVLGTTAAPLHTRCVSNEELIQAARGVLHRHTTADGRLLGDVGAALITAGGSLYVGVCADTPGWGLCAERSALAAMITNREDQVRKIVAVWEDDESGRLHVLPPCGGCREFLRSIDGSNLETEVILGTKKTSTLSELLPEHDWPAPIE